MHKGRFHVGLIRPLADTRNSGDGYRCEKLWIVEKVGLGKVWGWHTREHEPPFIPRRTATAIHYACIPVDNLSIRDIPGPHKSCVSLFLNSCISSWTDQHWWYHESIVDSCTNFLHAPLVPIVLGTISCPSHVVSLQ